MSSRKVQRCGRQEPRRPGPCPGDRGRPGGWRDHRSRARPGRRSHQSRPGRSVVGDRQRHRAGPAVPLADHVPPERRRRVRAGPRPGDRPRHAQRGLHRSGRSPSRRASSGRTATRSRLRRSPSASSGPSTLTPSRRAPARRTPSPTSRAATDYNGPYADPDAEFPGVEVDGNDIIMNFSTPFAEMDYYAIFPAIGPVPLDADADRLRQRAAVDRSLQDREVRPEPGARPRPERPVGPGH